MKNLLYLTPLVVNSAIALLITLSKREHSHIDGKETLFYYPSPYKTLLAFCSVFFASVPLWPGVAGDANPFLFAAVFIIIAAASAYFAIYFHKFNIVVRNEAFTLGAFSKKTYFLNDITKVEIISESNSSELVVYLKSGRKIRLSGLITDFPQLAELLQPKK